MKKIILVSVSFAICVIFISMIACNENSGSAGNSSGTQAETDSGAPAGGVPPAGAGETPGAAGAPAAAGEAGAIGPTNELEGSYVLDFLSPENAGDKTITIKDPKGNISATWVCTEHGFQELTNVSYDGEVLTFNALSGTPGDEYFYFHLEFIGGYLLGYAKTQEMHKSPIVGTPIELDIESHDNKI